MTFLFNWEKDQVMIIEQEEPLIYKTYQKGELIEQLTVRLELNLFIERMRELGWYKI